MENFSWPNCFLADSRRFSQISQIHLYYTELHREYTESHRGNIFSFVIF
jgi:hypothetical protein